jgi:hypothetical protein
LNEKCSVPGGHVHSQRIEGVSMSDPTTVFGDPKQEFSVPCDAAAQFTINGNELAAVFPGGQLRFDQDTGPTSLTQVMSISASITIPAGQQLIGYLQQLQYGVTRTPGVRVLIVADLAGTLETIELGYDPATAPGQDSPIIIASVFSLQGLESASASNLGLSPPVADYVATISVTIQRRTLKETAVVQVNGLDVAACVSPPAPAQA